MISFVMSSLSSFLTFGFSSSFSIHDQSGPFTNTLEKYQSVSTNKQRRSLISIWYTNADTLTTAKINELKEEFKSSYPPDIIAITEIKPKNYTSELNKLEYRIEGYNFEAINVDDRGSTRGVALYVRKSLKYLRIVSTKLIGTKEIIPSEAVSIELALTKNERILSNIYRSPNSSGKENDSINNFVKGIGTSKNAHQLIVGDFNRKDINWDTVTSPSDGDCKFIESIRDSYLTQHILTPTRGRGTSKPSLIDLLFTSKEECIENIGMHAHWESPITH